MNSEPDNVFKKLIDCTTEASSNPEECERLLMILSKTLDDEQLSSGSLDLCILHVFDETQGLLAFIKSTINKKNFSQSIVKCLDVIFVLINNYPKKSARYIVFINECCLTVVRSTLTSSDATVKALIVLELGFKKINKSTEYENDYLEVYRTLCNTLDFKKTDSVLGQLVSTIGTFAQMFPYLMSNPDDLEQRFIAMLEREMNAKELSTKAIPGLFRALSAFYKSFPPDPTKSENDEKITKLFKYIKQLAEPPKSKKEVNKSAMRFFSDNIDIFEKFILRESKPLHKALKKWLDAESVDDCMQGYHTLVSFYYGISKRLVLRKTDSFTTVTNYFVTHFSNILERPEETNFNKRSALNGLELFAGPCHQQLEPIEVPELMFTLLQYLERDYVITENPASDKWEFLPDFIQVIASFFHFVPLTPYEWLSLQRAVVNMIKHFHTIPFAQQYKVTNSFVAMLFYLKDNEEHFDNFLENIVYFGVTWTCSHQHISDTVEEKDSHKIVTVKKFLPFWSGITNPHDRLHFIIKISANDRYYISVKIVEKLVKTLLTLINRLDISIKRNDSKKPLTDPAAAYHVSKADDYAIFLNVVDFYQYIMPKVDHNMFQNCISRLITCFIQKCIDFPFVSGFYKLLATALIISNKLNYFDSSKIECVQDVTSCYESLIQFLEIILAKTNSFKDELLIACLQVLLECPSSAVTEIMDLCVPAFITAFKVGRGYLKLVTMALHTLKRWQTTISSENMEPLLRNILPCLDTFLRSQSLKGYTAPDEVEKRRKGLRSLTKRRILIEMEPELLQLQREILSFIGEQNSTLCQAFVHTDHYTEASLISNKKYLMIPLPYDDIKVELCLDSLVPRILDLALYCSDPKTRVTACEVLYGIVMVFLATSKSVSTKDVMDMDHLLKKMMLPLLQLGCDGNLVVKQIYKPLCLQITHWYAHRTQLRSSHTAVLIEALMEGITNPTDSALRDFCGECICDFVKWTIKQTLQDDLAADPINIKALINKMRFFSSHPDNCKKLGSSLIFNHIYKDLREEKCIFSIFWVELLHIFVTSLSQIEYETPENDNTVMQIGHALDHLERGLVEKNALFNQDDPLRRIPTDIHGRLLKDVLLWMFKYTGSRSSCCREKAMQLFIAISQCAKESKDNIPEFIAQNMKSENWVCETYESWLAKYPTLSDITEFESTAVLYRWMQSFATGLDGYTFLMKGRYTVHNLLTETSPTVKALRYFLKEMLTKPLDETLQLISSDSWCYPSVEANHYQKMKSMIVMKTIHFANAVVNHYFLDYDKELIWSQDMWQLIINCIFSPHILGFINFHKCTSKNHIELANHLLNAVCTKLPNTYKTSLIQALRDHIWLNLKCDWQLNRSFPKKERNFFKGLVSLDTINLNKEIDFDSMRSGMIKSFMGMFVSSESQLIVQNIPNTATEFCTYALHFATLSDSEFLIFLRYIYNETPAYNTDTHSSTLFGTYIIEKFEDVCMKVLIKKLDLYMNIVFDGTFSVSRTVVCLNKIVNYMINNRATYKHLYSVSAKTMLSKWCELDALLDSNHTNALSRMNLVRLLALISPKDIKCQSVNNWVIRLLCHTEFYFENKAQMIGFKIRVVETLAACFVDTEDNWKLCSPGIQKINRLIMSSDKQNASKLIKILPFTRSAHLACEVIKIFVLKQDSPIEEAFVKDLARYMKPLSVASQSATLEIIFGYCWNENLNTNQTYILTDKVLRFLLQYTSVIAKEQFYVAHMQQILICLESGTTDSNVMKKTVCAILVERLFTILPIGCEERRKCLITEKCLGTTDSKQLMQKCLKILMNVCKDSVPISEEYQELLRLYNCHSYNAMASILCNSVRKEEFFSKLFARWEGDRDILWSGLINTKKIYNFPEELHSLPERRKVLINIREKLKDQRKILNVPGGSVKYIESQRLFNSSLSEDITRYDFTNMSLTTTPDMDSMTSEDGEDDETKLNEIYIDETEVNKIEIMPTVCGIIQHIFKALITILPFEDEDPILPKWMEEIRKVLMSETTHKNVKIFLVKVIDNMAGVFQCYAKFFIEPLMKFIVDGCGGNMLNYFVIDIISFLATCSVTTPLVTEEEKQLASKLLEYLIEKTDNRRRDMFKYQLELVKLIVEAWRDSITVPTDLLLTKLGGDISSRKIEEGIHLSAILLANSLKPWSDSSKVVYLNRLLELLKSKNRRIFKPCAETIGLILKALQTDGEDEPYCQQIQSILEELKENNDVDNYCNSLESIAIYYTDIVKDTSHFSTLLSRLNSTSSNLQAVFLKIILRRTDILGEVSEFKIVPWHKYVESESFEVKITTLLIISKCLDILEPLNEFSQLIDTIMKNAKDISYQCRSLTYDIAMLICKTNNSDSSRFSSVVSSCHEVIIQGLTDVDSDNKQKLIRFLSEEGALPSNIHERYVYILCNLYKTTTEHNFLNYSTYFLLNILKNQEEYGKLIFNSALEDCDFEEYQIHLNWKKQHPCDVPLFVESLRTQEAPTDLEEDGFNQLRKTQTTFTFQQTKSVKEQELALLTKSQSSLYVTSDADDTEGSFLNPNTLTLSHDYRLPKRYFIKDRSKMSRFFANREVKKAHSQVAKRYQRAEENEKKVSICRSYRKGDLPDVQIQLSSLLDPLLILSQSDGEISKNLYVVLFKSLVHKLNHKGDFLANVTRGIKYIFENSVEYNTNVFRTFLDILIGNKKEMIISPDLISNVCQVSGLMSAGALLLEEYIISYDPDLPSSSAKVARGYNTSSEIKYWVKLSELYKELEEWDVVRAIFVSKMECDDKVQQAVLAESKKQWKDAQVLYSDLIESDPSLDRRDFYYESYFKCFASLGKWDEIPAAIEEFVKNDNDDGSNNPWNILWDGDWNQQKLLPWYITACIRYMLFNHQFSPCFLENILISLRDPHKEEYLRSNFGEELCMLWVFYKKTALASMVLSNELNNFLCSWQIVDPMFSSLRYQKILKLRYLVDISKFISIYDNLDPFDCEQVLDGLQNYWESSSNESLPSILLDEQKVVYRKQFSKLLVEKISSFKNQDELTHVMKKLIDVAMNFAYQMANVAVSQGNYSMAKKYYMSLMGTDTIEKRNLQVTYCQVLRLKADLYVHDEQKVTWLKETAVKLGNLLATTENIDTLLPAHSLYFESIEKLYEIFTINESLFHTYKDQVSESFHDSSVTINNPREMIDCAATRMKNTIERLEDQINETSMEDASSKKELMMIANSYSKLAYFYQAKHDNTAQFILCVLKAMRLECADVRQLFPCILMEKDLGTTYKDLFVAESEKIPTWMFLGWIPQLLTTVDQENVYATSKVLLRIAKSYPQAIMYGYRLSKENYNFEKMTTEARGLIERLDSMLLSDPIVNKFLRALSNVSMPASILKYYVAKLLQPAKLGMHDEVRNIRQRVLDDIYSEEPDQETSSMFGKLFEGIKQFRKEFQNMNCDNLADVHKKCEVMLRNLNHILEVLKKKKIKDIVLKDLCPWLDDFSACKLNCELEIPGQYDGLKMPLTQHHIKISSFIRTISVQESLRMPVKITILGNDTKEYSFLVKYGEDVRQDQRIEQIFALMNNFFQNDPNCSQNQLSLMTYQVIPLTTNLGIIKWVNDTTALGDFIMKPIQGPLKKQDFRDAIHLDHRNWIDRNVNNIDAFGKAAVKYNRNQTSTKYVEFVSRIKLDAMRMAFWDLSTSTESFIALKNTFIKSYAVLCASHWVLGIGDRHLSNVLICRNNGKVLGIDFGHAFGTATQILGVPELVPFRLTPHILNLMEPLREHGYFRENMIHTLNTLRNNSRSLLATMNVFIEEPSLDWVEHAMRVEGSADPADLEWYPAKKIDQAKRKLQGGNSTEFMIEDLKSGHKHRPQYMNAYINWVKGEPEYNLRARKAIDNLSVQDQVDCLIDHATDYNLLGRMFSGWEAWV